MRDTANFTVFGGVYPVETRSHDPIQRTSRPNAGAPLAAILFALVVGLSVTSGAVAAMKQIRATGYGFQNAGNMNIPGVPTLREVLW